MKSLVVSNLLHVAALLMASKLLGSIEIVEGQPAKWCHEAHNKDVRINYKLCYDILMGNSKLSEWEDSWRMAKVSASFGAYSANYAVRKSQTDITNQNTDPKIKPMLQECQDMYNKVEDTFVKAANRIDGRSQGDATGRAEVALTTSLAQRCEDNFATVRVQSPLLGSFFV